MVNCTQVAKMFHTFILALWDTFYLVLASSLSLLYIPIHIERKNEDDIRNKYDWLTPGYSIDVEVGNRPQKKRWEKGSIVCRYIN